MLFVFVPVLPSTFCAALLRPGLRRACFTMSAMMFSEEQEVPEGIAAHLALYGSTWLHSPRKVQRAERSLEKKFDLFATLVVVSALVVLLAHCAFHLEKIRHSGSPFRRLSYKVRL